MTNTFVRKCVTYHYDYAQRNLGPAEHKRTHRHAGMVIDLFRTETAPFTEKEWMNNATTTIDFR